MGAEIEPYMVYKEAIEVVGKASSAVEEALDLLLGPYDEEWNEADLQCCLWELTPEQLDDLVDRLAAILLPRKDRKWSVQIAAAEALQVLGPLAHRAVPALASMLSDDHWKVRKVAVETLAGMGRMAAEASPELFKVAGDDIPILRDLAADALNKIHGPVVRQCPCVNMDMPGTE